MGKTRDLFKKIKNTKGKFHAKMDTIQDRIGIDLTKAEEMVRIHRRIRQKKKKKKELNGPDNHDVVITHLEPDILE